MYLVVKALLSGLVIAVASEAARRWTLLGAILISLPLTSILALAWLYFDTRDAQQVIDLSWSILWVVVPSLVFFIALPLLLRSGLVFVPALLVACAITAVAYAAWIGLARALGLSV
jgi:hypothetical protein